MSKSKFYDLDWKQIHKGSVFPVDELERLTGSKRGTEEYGLEVLKFRGEIRRRMAEQEIAVEVAQQNGVLKVLTDSEATEYTHACFLAALNGASNLHNRSTDIDHAGLSTEEKNRHLRRLTGQAMIVSAIEKKRGEIEIAAYESGLPQLFTRQQIQLEEENPS